MEDFDLQDLCEGLLAKSAGSNGVSGSKQAAIRQTNEMQGYVGILSEMSEAEGGGVISGADDSDDDDDDEKNSAGGWIDRMNSEREENSDDSSDSEDSDDDEDETEETDEGEDSEDNGGGDDEGEDEWSSENGAGVDVGVSEDFSDADMSKISDFGITLMMFATEAHFWHLNCNKNSIHVALQDLYEACTDNADKILEAVIGMTDKPCEPSMPDIEFGNLVYDEGCIDKIKKIRDTASELADNENEGINNILGDVCESCDTAIYKLTRLT